MHVGKVLERIGFDTTRLEFTLRTALVAFGAMGIAWLIGLEHPQWSGMTVWASSQLVRGQLLSRSLFRVVGTIAGSIVGLALLIASNGQPWPIIIGLSLWIGLCAGAGNIVRGFASYGVMLAGYSAAMVAILASSQSPSYLATGVDRMLTVLLGVLLALAVGWKFAARGDMDDPRVRIHRITVRLLSALAAYLEEEGQQRTEEQDALFSEIAAIDDRLEIEFAGIRGARAIIQSSHQVLLSQVAILLWIRHSPAKAGNATLAAAIKQVAGLLDTSGRTTDGYAALHRAAKGACDPHLRAALRGLIPSRTPGMIAGDPSSMGRQAASRPFAIHRDWSGAWKAMVRATCVLLCVGTVWLVTGWQAGSFMLLGTAIMMTIFSVSSNPAAMLREVLIGHVLGVAGALVCRWLVWPHASGELGQLLAILPFMLLGGLLFAHRRTSGPIGFDYNMIVLLLLQPGWPLTVSFEQSLAYGLAVILGPIIGLIAFKLIIPVNSTLRQQELMAAMIHDVEIMASQHKPLRRPSFWRMRLYHRMLRLVSLAGSSGATREMVIERCLTVLLVGTAILHLNVLLRKPGSTSGTIRRIKTALDRLSRVGRQPRRAARTLARTADYLVSTSKTSPALLHEASIRLFRHSELIRSSVPTP